MHRRRFLRTSLASSAALAVSSSSQAQTPSGKGRQYYALRKYTLVQNGISPGVTDTYVSDALIPALNRLGITSVGAFRLSIGPETPALYLLLPSQDLESLVKVDMHLADDAAFQKTAAPFWSAPLAQPPFARCDSHLLLALEGFPSLIVPEKGKRIFQLRTYYSPTHAAHVRKIEMFHHGEFTIFKNAGCQSVFYSAGLVGDQLPSITYMLTFPDQAALDAGWARFMADPEWNKLKTSPRYSDPIVSNIDNLILTPAPYSQI